MHLSKAPRCPDCGSPMFPGTAHTCPPLVKGGQGRSGNDVAGERWAGVAAFLLLIFAGITILGHCST